MANIHISRNPLQNINDTEQFTASTVREAAEPLHGMMIIAVVNGVPTLRADWGAKLQQDDVVLIIVRPRGGGGGSNPLRLLATLALMAFAGWIVGPSMLALGKTAAAFVRMGIMMAGSALINQLMPPPKLPETRALPEPSPSYSLRGQVNAARLGQPIPAHYGRHIVYPDYVMTPYYEYVGSDQYYNLLLCLGTGAIDITDVKFGDSTLSGLAADVAQAETILPGQHPTIIPSTVYSTAVSAELEQDWSVPAITNPPGTSVTRLGFDFAFNGLCLIGSDGNPQPYAVTVQVQARAISDTGEPLQDWGYAVNHTYEDDTVDVIRDTQYADVTAGRYEVRAKVTAPASPVTDGRDANGNTVRGTCNWGGARGYDSTPVDYGDVTLLAIRLKANEMLSDQQTQQISCVGYRRLRQWSAGNWTTAADSRSIVWAIADMYLSQNHGKQPENTLVLSEMAVLDAKLEAINHHFDYRFDQSGQKLLDAMSIAARAGRSIVAHHIGRWRLLRDELKTVPVQMFTADNIVDCSITLSAPQAYDPDALVGTFIDPDTWQQDTLTFSDAENPIRPEAVELTGITGRQHAWEELAYMARAERRKERGTLTTGMEGRIPVIYDLIAVCPEGVNWGEWGHVTEIEGSTYKLSTPLSISSGKIMLRNSRGGSLGVYSFTADGSRAVLSNPPALTLPDVQHEPIYFIAGETESSIILAKVESVKPSGNNQISIDFVVEDASTHDSAGEAPEGTTSGTGGGVSAETMVIPWLNVTNTLTSDTVCRMQFAWGAVAAATRYDTEIKVNDGAWRAVTVNADNTSVSEVAPEQTIYFRVRARATAIIGEWRTLETASCSDAVPRDPGELSLRSPFITGVLKVKWTLVVGIANYVLRIYDTATLTLRREVNTTWQEYDYSYLDAISDGGTFRRMTLRLHTKLAGVISTTYSELEVYNPQVGALSGLDVVGFTGLIGVLYDTPAQADYAGILVWASETAGFTPSAANLVYDGKDPVIGIKTTSGAPYYVRVAAYDYWGRDELILSSEQSGSAILVDLTEINSALDELAYDLNHIDGTTQINENSISTGKLVAFAVSADKIAANAITAGKIAALAVSADKIAANAVTADKLLVANLAAINANMGTITAGTLQNPTGRAVFNLNASGAQNYIYLADTLGNRRFSVDANGGVSLTGAVSLIDPSSQYPLFSTAQHSRQVGYIANAATPSTANAVAFYAPNHHASAAIAQRIRASGQLVPFVVTASAVVDHFFTLWYSYGGGSWTPIWTVYEPQAGVGNTSLTVQANLYVNNSDVVYFCCTSSTQSQQSGSPEFINLTLSASAVNI